MKILKSVKYQCPGNFHRNRWYFSVYILYQPHVHMTRPPLTSGGPGPHWVLTLAWVNISLSIFIFRQTWLLMEWAQYPTECSHWPEQTLISQTRPPLTSGGPGPHWVLTLAWVNTFRQVWLPPEWHRNSQSGCSKHWDQPSEIPWSHCSLSSHTGLSKHLLARPGFPTPVRAKDPIECSHWPEWWFKALVQACCDSLVDNYF